ncbi:MAG: hypothetical protein M3Z21_09205, partial [Pseudomonadota bacterium]|nr:hypothetical protein [Pseudomonadota bacterium]
LLVALGAIHHANPEWLNDENFNTLTGNFALLEHYGSSSRDPAMFNALSSAIARHKQAFGNWPPTPEQGELFRAISAGIHVS